MGRLESILDAFKTIVRYAPYFWLGIRTIFELWKARLKQKAVRDALDKERERRVAVERQVDLSESRAGDVVERTDRALARAIAREAKRRGLVGQPDGDNKPD